MGKRGLKVATIGGGSSYTPELIEGFIKRQEELPVKEIWLVDIEEGKKKLDIVGNLSKRMVEKAGADIDIHLTLDRREAIKEADFITTQFRVGLLDARIKDEKIPLKYGVIGQETTGPGGFAKAQRTIPVILDICKDIEELSPNGWLINFTNPSGIITETVLKYTNVKVVGLCNVPITMQYQIANILEVDPKRVYVDFVGLNHLVWGRRVYLDGQDITKDVVDKLADGKIINMKNIADFKWNRDFIRGLQMIPCPYHRYYYEGDKVLQEELEALSKEGTRGEIVKKVEEDLFKLYEDVNLNIKPPQLEKRGGAHYSDAACSLISSIYNDKKDIQVVNVKNNGAIMDLPNNVVIETNCIISKEGPLPLAKGSMSPKIRGLMSLVKSYEELTIEAGVHGDYDEGLQGLTLHPLVPSAEVAKKILDDIIKENIEYLPQYQEKNM